MCGARRRPARFDGSGPRAPTTCALAPARGAPHRAPAAACRSPKLGPKRPKRRTFAPPQRARWKRVPACPRAFAEISTDIFIGVAARRFRSAVAVLLPLPPDTLALRIEQGSATTTVHAGIPTRAPQTPSNFLLLPPLAQIKFQRNILPRFLFVEEIESFS